MVFAICSVTLFWTTWANLSSDANSQEPLITALRNKIRELETKVGACRQKYQQCQQVRQPALDLTTLQNENTALRARIVEMKEKAQGGKKDQGNQKLSAAAMQAMLGARNKVNSQAAVAECSKQLEDSTRERGEVPA